MKWRKRWLCWVLQDLPTMLKRSHHCQSSSPGMKWQASFFLLVSVSPSGIYISLDVLPFWADPESCSPSSFVMIFLTIDIKDIKCDMVAKKSVLCHLVFHLFHVLRALYFLHVLPTYPMLSHPGWQAGAICRTLFTLLFCCRALHWFMYSSWPVDDW